MRREDAITLFRCIRTGDSQSSARLGSISLDEWQNALRDLDQLGLAPLFYRYACNHDLSRLIPEEVMQTLQQLYFLNAAKNSVVYNDLQELLETLTKESVQIIVLKGIYLAAAVYNDIALRPMSDIDILAKKEDLSKIEKLLLDMGYGPAGRPPIKKQCRAHHHLIPFTKPGKPSIEVHWTLDRITSGFSIDMDEVWSRAREVEISGCNVLALSVEDLLLHLCLHFSANHRLSILEIKNLCDISEVIRRFGNEIDWEQFLSHTKRYRTGRFVYCSLILTQKILGTVMPPEVLKIFCRNIEDKEMADTIMNFVLTDMPLPLALPGVMDRIENEYRLTGKIKILSQTLFPSPSLLKKKYKSSDAINNFAELRLRYWSELLIRSSILLGNLVFRTWKANPAIERRRKSVLINNWLKEAIE